MAVRVFWRVGEGVAEMGRMGRRGKWLERRMAGVEGVESELIGEAGAEMVVGIVAQSVFVDQERAEMSGLEGEAGFQDHRAVSVSYPAGIALPCK